MSTASGNEDMGSITPKVALQDCGTVQGVLEPVGPVFQHGKTVVDVTVKIEEENENTKNSSKYNLRPRPRKHYSELIKKNRKEGIKKKKPKVICKRKDRNSIIGPPAANITEGPMEVEAVPQSSSSLLNLERRDYEDNGNVRDGVPKLIVDRMIPERNVSRTERMSKSINTGRRNRQQERILEIKYLGSRRIIVARWKDSEDSNSWRNLNHFGQDGLVKFIHGFAPQHWGVVRTAPLGEIGQKRLHRSSLLPNVSSPSSRFTPLDDPNSQTVAPLQADESRIDDERLRLVSAKNSRNVTSRGSLAGEMQSVLRPMFEDARPEVRTYPRGPLYFQQSSSVPLLIGEGTVLERPQVFPNREIYILRVIEGHDIRFLHVDPNTPSRQDMLHGLKLTEEVVGRYPDSTYGAPVFIKNRHYCFVKFQGCAYMEIVEAEVLFHAFPELDNRVACITEASNSVKENPGNNSLISKCNIV